jgi:PTH1 family peptidyl-tRNA hydrolase
MESRRTFLVVGLGNPGVQYRKSRHNIGFVAVDFLAKKMNRPFALHSSWLGETAEMHCDAFSLVLLKPHTYMNASGRSVRRAVEEMNLALDRLIVIHDDLDLEFGRIKIVFNRGAGGHKGINSIMDEIRDRRFIRIKCGIGRPEEEVQVVDHVLSAFNEKESEMLSGVCQEIAEAFNLIGTQGLTAAMNRMNRPLVEKE